MQVEQKPQSDALVSAFVSAHQAAKRMMYSDRAGLKWVDKKCTDDKEHDSEGYCLQDKKGTDGQVVIDSNGQVVKERIPIQVEDVSTRTVQFSYKQAIKSLVETECVNDAITSGIFSFGCDKEDGPAEAARSVGNLATLNSEDLKSVNRLVDVDGLGITSAIACISNKVKTTDSFGINVEVNDPQTPYLTFDCEGGKTGGIGDYIITYMQAPSTERSILSRNELWRSGILRRTKGSHECGVLWPVNQSVTVQSQATNSVGEEIVFDEEIEITAKRQKYDINGEYVLDNSRRFTVSVPRAITNVLKKDPALKNDMDSGYLLFCITPIDDIRASFEWQCKHGYGRYKIMDGDEIVQDCTTK